MISSRGKLGKRLSDSLFFISYVTSMCVDTVLRAFKFALCE